MNSTTPTNGNGRMHQESPSLQQHLEQLLQRRQQLVAEIDAIDEELLGVQDKIAEVVTGHDFVPTGGNSTSLTARSSSPRTRNDSGTSRLLEFLRKHGRLARRDVVVWCEHNGVNAESSLYSLKNRGLVRREGGFVEVTKDGMGDEEGARE